MKTSFLNDSDFFDQVNTLLALPGMAVWFGGTYDTATFFIEPFSTFELPRAEQFSAHQKKHALAEFNHWLKQHRDPAAVPSIFGFLSYEAFHYTETLASSSDDQFHFPAGIFCAYKRIITVTAHDYRIHVTEHTAKHLWELSLSSSQIDLLVRYGKLLLDNMSSNENSFYNEQASDFSLYCSLEEQKQFLKGIEDIHTSIRKGDVYQANLSLPFHARTTKSNSRLLADSVSAEKAPFAAFFNCSVLLKDIAIISNSPEKFIYRQKESAAAAPIKGTVRALTDPVANAEALQLLLDSPKDRAELAMIVDLFRNDFGKIASVGTVSVGSFPSSLSLHNLHHLFADISANIPSDISDVDLILSCFPSGSISGAPKYTALQTITRLENAARGVYCGGFFAFDGTGFSSSVAIRTAVRHKDLVTFRTGCGITIDSVPQEELEEAFTKAKGLLYALNVT